MSSKYWDDFERRARETALCLGLKTKPPVRRVAIFITNRCNFKCSYCNHTRSPATLDPETFYGLFARYGKDCIYHITGGEPSVVGWLYGAIQNLSMRGFNINLNTNCYITPPAYWVGRLKVSLDSFAKDECDRLYGVPGAFDIVCKNIKKASKECDLSITFTMGAHNYRKAPLFAWWSLREFPDQMATFFSIYKGDDPRYAWTDQTVEDFWTNCRPLMIEHMKGTESGELFEETCTDPRRIRQGTRFIENSDVGDTCYLSLSERVVSPTGKIYGCSHLYRDGVFTNNSRKDAKCQYGCNLRLVKFNEEVSRRVYGLEKE